MFSPNHFLTHMHQVITFLFSTEPRTSPDRSFARLDVVFRPFSKTLTVHKKGRVLYARYFLLSTRSPSSPGFWATFTFKNFKMACTDFFKTLSKFACYPALLTSKFCSLRWLTTVLMEYKSTIFNSFEKGSKLFFPSLFNACLSLLPFYVKFEQLNVNKWPKWATEHPMRDWALVG